MGADISGNISTNNLVATRGTIGGWRINNSAIYNDYITTTDGSVRRAYIQTLAKDGNWAFSVQKYTSKTALTNGETLRETFP